MRILIIMGGFFPGKKFGGPPVSVDNFCSLLSEEECFVLTYDHDLGENDRYTDISDGWNDRGNCQVLYVSDEEYNKETYEKVIQEIRPDLLYLQGLFQSCVLPCLNLAKKYGLPVLLAPRGELCSGALNIKKYKKLPYIKLVRLLGITKNIHWQSTSEEETAAIIKLLGADEKKIYRLDNIPSIPKAAYPRTKKTAGEGKFVFISRIHPKKNLLSAINFFNSVQGTAIFDIYGPIEDDEYWKQCQDEIENLPSNVKVEYKGLIEHDKVHETFSKYDAFLFPTLSENYGHVIAESMIVGTPVIISDQTPWRDLKEAGAGWDIDINNRSAFEKAVQTVVLWSDKEMSEAISQCKAYSTKAMNLDGLKYEYTSVLCSLK